MEEDAEFVRDYSFSLQCHLGKVLNAQVGFMSFLNVWNQADSA